MIDQFRSPCVIHSHPLSPLLRVRPLHQRHMRSNQRFYHLLTICYGPNKLLIPSPATLRLTCQTSAGTSHFCGRPSDSLFQPLHTFSIELTVDFTSCNIAANLPGVRKHVSLLRLTFRQFISSPANCFACNKLLISSPAALIHTCRLPASSPQKCDVPSGCSFHPLQTVLHVINC